MLETSKKIAKEAVVLLPLIKGQKDKMPESSASGKRFVCLKLYLCICMISAFGILSANLIPNSPNPSITPLGDGKFRIEAQEQIVNISPEEAERRAINKARRMAVEYEAGVDLSSWTLVYESENEEGYLRQFLSKINQVLSRGFVFNQQLLKSETLLQDGIPIKRVVLELEVGRQSGERDPSFRIEASLNKLTFRELDRLQLEITPSQGCYITVLNIYSDNSISLLFPNQHSPSGYTEAGTNLRIPHENAVYVLPVHLSPDRDTDAESIMIVATKSPLNTALFQTISEYNTYTDSLDRFIRQILEIPRDQIEISFLDYTIHRR